MLQFKDNISLVQSDFNSRYERKKHLGEKWFTESLGGYDVDLAELCINSTFKYFTTWKRSLSIQYILKTTVKALKKIKLRHHNL